MQDLNSTIWGLDLMITFVLIDFMMQSILGGSDKWREACEMITVSSVESCHI